MFLVSIAILSFIVALIRKGSFANILHSELKAPFLFILSLLLFIAVEVGSTAGITVITDWSYYITLGAYLILLLAIILNLNIWMFILLLGSLANFIVIFINGGKLPVSLETLTMAGLTESFVENSSTLALTTSTTHFPFLGAIIPIPLPGGFAQVISPGTILIGLGLFMIIQNIMLGVVYEDEEDDNEYLEVSEETFSKKRSRKKETDDIDENIMYDEDDEIDEEEFGKNYTIGNINIDDLDGLDDEIDDTLFTAATLADDLNDEEENPVEFASLDNTEDEPTYIDDDQQEQTQPLGFNKTSIPETAEPFGTDEMLSLDENIEDESFDDNEESEETVWDESEVFEDESERTELESEEEEDIYDSETDYEQPDESLYDEENEEESVFSYEDDTRDHDELTLSTEALREAQDVIEQEIPAQQELLEQQKQSKETDEPLEADTDSPFIIVNGRIVENPYYKFRKGTKREPEETPSQIPNGIQVMKSRKPTSSGRPSFAPPTQRTQTKLPSSLQQDTDEKNDESNGYEKVEMKIGDVQIRFWKKDNEE